MITIRHLARLPRATACVLLVPLVACSGDDPASPAAPEPTTTYEAMQATFTVLRFECLTDGDGVEGAGEFDFQVDVPYMNETWERNLSSGQSAALDWTNTIGMGTYTADTPEPRAYTEAFVKFKCTEWDKDVLGRDFPDSDMDAREATARHTPVAGTEVVNYITLGNDQCRVRLHYRIVFELIRFEE
ncbi:MAG: hypothetical protein R6X35_04840 [Candidatus Krumholzibacteriia bacterium]